MKSTTDLLYRLQLFFQLQLKGGYDPLFYRLQPEGSYHSLDFRLLPEGGYDLLSLPRPATLIRGILLNLWTCHTQNPAVDNFCTVYCQVSLITDADTLCTTLYICDVPTSESASAYRSLSSTISEVSLLCYR